MSQKYVYGDNTITVYKDAYNDVWFDASDITDILGPTDDEFVLSWSQMPEPKLCDSDTTKFMSERGVYDALASNYKVHFLDWLFSNVLPSERRIICLEFILEKWSDEMIELRRNKSELDLRDEQIKQLSRKLMVFELFFDEEKYSAEHKIEIEKWASMVKERERTIADLELQLFKDENMIESLREQLEEPRKQRRINTLDF